MPLLKTVNLKRGGNDSPVDVEKCAIAHNVLSSDFAGGKRQPMDATQENLLVLLVILAMAGVLAVLVGVFSSQSLRDEGLRRVVKRWLGR